MSLIRIADKMKEMSHFMVMFQKKQTTWEGES
jgi:hypothetical protein